MCQKPSIETICPHHLDLPLRSPLEASSMLTRVKGHQATDVELMEFYRDVSTARVNKQRRPLATLDPNTPQTQKKPASGTGTTASPAIKTRKKLGPRLFETAAEPYCTSEPVFVKTYLDMGVEGLDYIPPYLLTVARINQALDKQIELNNDTTRLNRTSVLLSLSLVIASVAVACCGYIAIGITVLTLAVIGLSASYMQAAVDKRHHDEQVASIIGDALGKAVESRAAKQDSTMLLRRLCEMRFILRERINSRIDVQINKKKLVLVDQKLQQLVPSDLYQEVHELDAETVSKMRADPCKTQEDIEACLAKYAGQRADNTTAPSP